MTNRHLRVGIWLGRGVTILFYLAFAAELILLSRTSLLQGATLLLCAGVAFAAVWLLRRLLGRKRPYQQDDALPRLRCGTNDSFPSLHVFSAFYIATAAFAVSPALSYALLACATALAVLRVLLSIHYPRDAVGGAFIGVALSVITLILL